MPILPHKYVLSGYITGQVDTSFAQEQEPATARSGQDWAETNSSPSSRTKKIYSFFIEASGTER